MNVSFLDLFGLQRLNGLSLVLAAASLGAFLYGIWIAGVTPAAAAAIGLLPVALGLCVQWPALALAAITMTIAAEVSRNLTDQFGLPSITDLMVPGAALVLCLRYVLVGKGPFLSGKALAGLAIVLMMSALSILYARYWEVAQNTAFGMGKDLTLVLLLLAFIDSPRMLRVFLNTLVVTLSIICVLGLYRYVTGSQNSFYGFVEFAFVERRFTGPYTDANFFGSFLAFLIPICLGMILSVQQARQMVFPLFGVIALMIGLLLTASRGDLLALLISLPIFLVFLTNKARVWTLGLGFGVVVVVALLLSDQLITRFQFLVDPSVALPAADRAVEGRLASWDVAMQLFYDHPLIGVGAGNFNAYFQDTALNLGLIFRGEGRSAHSLYLEVLAEHGIFGLGLLLVVLTAAVVTPFRVALRLTRTGAKAQAMVLQGFAIGLVAMLLARIFLHDDYPILLWVAVAIGLAADRIFHESLLPRTDR